MVHNKPDVWRIPGAGVIKVFPTYTAFEPTPERRPQESLKGYARAGDVIINIQHADLSSERGIQQTARMLAKEESIERRRLGLGD